MARILGTINDTTGGRVLGNIQPEQPEQSLTQKVASGLDTFFGGGKAGEALGTEIARGTFGKTLQRIWTGQDLSPEASQFITQDVTKGQVLGSALQSASLFAPIGRIAGGITAGLRGVGMKTGVSAIGKIGSGALTGGAFDVASNLQQGKTGADVFTPSFGTAIGAGIPAVGVAKNVTLRFTQAQAPRVINSLIKPLQKDFSYGKDPGRAVAEEKIIANNWDDFIAKIATRRQEIGSKIGALGNTLEGKVKLNLQTALSPLDEAMQLAASQNNPTVLNRLQNVKRAIVEDLGLSFDETGVAQIVTKGMKNLTDASFKESRSMLGRIGDITQFTGNPSDDKVVNSALKRVYGKIKEATVKSAYSVDSKIGKDFEKLTEKYADLSSAQIAAKYRDKIVERSNLISLSPQVAGIGTALLTFVATGGAATPAILAGLAGAALDKLAATPAFKTRLASILVKKSPQEVSKLFQKVPALQKLFPKNSPISPGDRLLNTKTGQKIEQGVKDYIKNPKMGLSMEDVTKSNPLYQEARKYKTPEEFVKAQWGTKITSAERLSAKEQEYLTNAIERAGVRPKEIRVLSRYSNESYADADNITGIIRINKNAYGHDSKTFGEIVDHELGHHIMHQFEWNRIKGLPDDFKHPKPLGSIKKGDDFWKFAETYSGHTRQYLKKLNNKDFAIAKEAHAEIEAEIYKAYVRGEKIPSGYREFFDTIKATLISKVTAKVKDLPKLPKLPKILPTQDDIPVNEVGFHGTQAKEIRGTPNKTRGTMGNAFYLADSPEAALNFGTDKSVVIGGNKMRVSGAHQKANKYTFDLSDLKIKRFKNDAEFFDFVKDPDIEKWFRLAGYDGAYITKHGNYAIYNTEKLKQIPTKSQLTDIWKKAKNIKS